MRRVAPSAIVREEIDELLAGGVALAQLGVRYVVQQGLEQEQTDHLGRGRYERGAGTRGRRNGYEDATLRTGEGGIGVRVPQVRGAEVPYRSKLIEFLAGNTEALDRLVVEMDARGLSTRDIEDAFRGPEGELLISRPTSARSPTDCGRTTRPSARATCPRLTRSTCSSTRSSNLCVATAPKRRCSPPGASPRLATRCCCTWRSATRNPRPAGPSSSAT